MIKNITKILSSIFASIMFVVTGGIIASAKDFLFFIAFAIGLLVWISTSFNPIVGMLFFAGLVVKLCSKEESTESKCAE